MQEVNSIKVMKQTVKRYCSIVFIIAIAVSAFCFIMSINSVGQGMLLGTLFGALNFLMMGIIIIVKLGSNPKKAQTVSFFSFVFRYAIMAVPIILAIKMEEFNVISTVIGLLMIQVVIFIERTFPLIRILKT